MTYVIVFDDRRFAGFCGYVREYPDARLFTNKREAEKYARTFNSPSTVTSTEEYAQS